MGPGAPGFAHGDVTKGPQNMGKQSLPMPPMSFSIANFDSNWNTPAVPPHASIV